MPILYIFLALFLLGILITVHEFGHFFAARLTGIAVKEFSVGFGPTLLKWKSKKHDTVFFLRPIPLGGYCMYFGDTDDDPLGEKTDDLRNFNRAPVGKRMLSVFAGPLMNFVLAFVVSVGIMAGYGVSPAQPFVREVESGMPAQQAGLQANDIFLTVGDFSIHENSTAGDVSNAISAAQPGAPLPVTVLRNGEELSFSVLPVQVDDGDEPVYRIGISIYSAVPMPISRYIPAAWDSCVHAGGLILSSLGRLLTTGEGIQDTAGPIGIVHMVAEQTRRGGLEIFLTMMVVISINLGLFNLLPVPALDGSRLIFLMIEAVRRKPVSQRVEARIHMVGLMLLLGMILLFTFRDIGRIFGA